MYRKLFFGAGVACALLGCTKKNGAAHRASGEPGTLAIECKGSEEISRETYSLASSFGYLAPARFLELQLTCDRNLEDHSRLLQALGQLRSFFGDELASREAMKQAGIMRRPNNTYIPSVETEPGVSAMRFPGAIVERAKTKTVVMINEAHHLPEHRVSTMHLLEPLYALGFRYFAAETFSGDIEETQNRGYAQRRKSGYYSDEPMFAELIRQAVAIGYTLIPYEFRPTGCEPSTSDCFTARESGQAKRLSDFLGSKKDAKVLVHAGYGHIYEESTGNVRMMASYFKNRTGIDPLTITQTFIESEHHQQSGSHPSVNKLYFSKTSAERLVFKGSDFTSTAPGGVDLVIVHRDLELRDGRGAWLENVPKRKLELVPSGMCKNAQGELLQVFYKDEFPKAVPLDQYMPKTTPCRLSVPVGKTNELLLVVSGNKGKTLASSPWDNVK